MTVEERFWEKVARGAPDACWRWRGGRVGDKAEDRGRYGRFAKSTTRGAVVLVLPHRYSWELHYGPIPPGLSVLHACDEPSCVNPEHLMLGTTRANAVDAIRKGRRPGLPARSAS